MKLQSIFLLIGGLIVIGWAVVIIAAAIRYEKIVSRYGSGANRVKQPILK